MSDEELVLSGDEGLLADLCERWQNRIKKIVNDKAFVLEPLVGFDDAVQIGTIAVYFGAKAFDHTKGVPLGGWLYVCIRRRLYDAVKKALTHRSCSNYIKTNIPLDNPEIPPDRCYPLLPFLKSSSCEEEFLRKEFREELLSKLSPIEQQFLLLRLDGLSYLEIAEKMGEGFKTVDNAKQRVRRKARRLLQNGGRTDSIQPH